jgi:uncharacterized protein YcnI
VLRHAFPPRALRIAAAAGLLLVAGAGPAAAHVTVSSPDATPGGFGKLVVRVPTESDTASTVKVQVTLPAETPFAFVSTKPHPGWTVATTERTLDEPVTVEGFTLSKAVATVTWTASADGTGIGPGQFDEFELSLGPFPASAGALPFPATQTYDDGTVVQWNQPSQEGQEEPEHPAPTLQLAAAADGADAGTSAPPAEPVAAESTSAADDTTARWMAGGGLAVAVTALAVAVVALVRRPRSADGGTAG